MKILTVLSPSWDGELSLLEQQLRPDGILLERISPDALSALLKTQQAACSADIFVLTDRESVGRVLTRARIPWAGCGREVWFEGAVLVLESLEGIDGNYLKEWMRREQGKPVTIAKTEGLTIREILEEDFDDLIRICRQTGAGGRSSPLTREILRAYIDTAYRLQGYGLWSVLYGETLIGSCGFAPAPAGALELQYMLDPAYQGQGFGTKMCRAALEYARERLHAKDICVRISPGNAASLALARKLNVTIILEEN